MSPVLAVGGGRCVFVELRAPGVAATVLALQEPLLETASAIVVRAHYCFSALRKVRLKDDLGFETTAYCSTEGSLIARVEGEEEVDGAADGEPGELSPEQAAGLSGECDVTGSLRSLSAIGWVSLVDCSLSSALGERRLAFTKLFFPHYWTGLSHRPGAETVVEVRNVLPVHLWGRLEGFCSSVRTSARLVRAQSALAGRGPRLAVPPAVAERCALHLVWASRALPQLTRCVERRLGPGSAAALELLAQTLSNLTPRIACRSALHDFCEPRHYDLHSIRACMDADHLGSLLPELVCCAAVHRAARQTPSPFAPLAALFEHGPWGHERLLVASVLRLHATPELLCLTLVDVSGATLVCLVRGAGAARTRLLRGGGLVVAVRAPLVLTGAGAPPRVTAVADCERVHVIGLDDDAAGRASDCFLRTCSFAEATAAVADAYARGCERPSCIALEAPTQLGVRELLALTQPNAVVDLLALAVGSQRGSAAGQLVLILRDARYPDCIRLYLDAAAAQGLHAGLLLAVRGAKLLSARRHRYCLLKGSVGVQGVDFNEARSARAAPRTCIGALFNSARLGCCRWRLLARVARVGRVRVSLKCAACHNQGALVCAVCGTAEHLRHVWELTLTVEDGTGRCAAVLEQQDVRLLFGRTRADRALVDGLVRGVEERCRIKGSVSVEGGLLEDDALRAFDAARCAALLSAPRTADSSLDWHSGEVQVVQHLVRLVNDADLFELTATPLLLGGARGRALTAKADLQRVDRYGSDRIELPCACPEPLVLTVIAVRAVSRNELNIDANSMLRELRDCMPRALRQRTPCP